MAASPATTAAPPLPESPLLSRKSGCIMLRRYYVYRLVLATLMLVLFFSKSGYVPLGRFSPLLFSITGFAYLGFVLAGGLMLLLRSHSCEQHAYLMVFLDIPALTLLMHASGGIETGLGLLIAISIALGSLIMRGRAALVFASIATLAILTQQIYTEITLNLKVTAYTQSGLLGASFFAMALLAETLSRRLRESERLASQRELDLANLAQLNAYIIKHMQTGVLVLDSQQVIRLINDAAAGLLGIVKPRTGVVLAQVAPWLKARLDEGKEAQFAQTGLFTPAPQARELQLRVNTLGRHTAAGTLVLIEDAAAITEQAQQMKLASLGRLTASIAHEIRNPLGAIGHAEQLLAESPSLLPEDRRLIEIIHNHTRRVNEIIEDVLRLSRRERATPDRVPLAQWLDAFMAEFRQQHGLSDEQAGTVYSAAEIVVRVDPGQLQQVLTNLCTNTLRHFHRPLEALRLRLVLDEARDHSHAYIDVEDNGPGIPDAVRGQVFDPFFTTKTTGTGLGLFLARELCQANHLRLELLANEGEGCRFRITIPAEVLEQTA